MVSRRIFSVFGVFQHQIFDFLIPFKESSRIIFRAKNKRIFGESCAFIGFEGNRDIAFIFRAAHYGIPKVFIENYHIASFANDDINVVRHTGDGTAVYLYEIISCLALDRVSFIGADKCSFFTVAIDSYITVGRYIRHFTAGSRIEIRMTNAAAGTVFADGNLIVLRNSIVYRRTREYGDEPTDKIRRYGIQIQQRYTAVSMFSCIKMNILHAVESIRSLAHIDAVISRKLVRHERIGTRNNPRRCFTNSISIEFYVICSRQGEVFPSFDCFQLAVLQRDAVIIGDGIIYSSFRTTCHADIIHIPIDLCVFFTVTDDVGIAGSFKPRICQIDMDV